MWNNTIVIENKAGAAGVIAADFVAKQPADGNTLLMAHINSHAIAPSLQPKPAPSGQRPPGRTDHGRARVCRF
jgi:tripartite-type tricarboxylate transporter receptor subunit TctC